jgi:hypothetical protein
MDDKFDQDATNFKRQPLSYKGRLSTYPALQVKTADGIKALSVDEIESFIVDAILLGEKGFELVKDTTRCFRQQGEVFCRHESSVDWTFTMADSRNKKIKATPMTEFNFPLTIITFKDRKGVVRT